MWPLPQPDSSHPRRITLVPFTVISLIFLVFSSIHFSRRIFSFALISSFSFFISCLEANGDSFREAPNKPRGLAAQEGEEGKSKSRRLAQPGPGTSSLPRDAAARSSPSACSSPRGRGCCCPQTLSAGERANSQESPGWLRQRAATEGRGG